MSDATEVDKMIDQIMKDLQQVLQWDRDGLPEEEEEEEEEADDEETHA